jgi:hypothetical protein
VDGEQVSQRWQPGMVSPRVSIMPGSRGAHHRRHACAARPGQIAARGLRERAWCGGGIESAGPVCR